MLLPTFAAIIAISLYVISLSLAEEIFFARKSAEKPDDDTDFSRKSADFDKKAFVCGNNKEDFAKESCISDEISAVFSENATDFNATSADFNAFATDSDENNDIFNVNETDSDKNTDVFKTNATDFEEQIVSNLNANRNRQKLFTASETTTRYERIDADARREKSKILPSSDRIFHNLTPNDICLKHDLPLNSTNNPHFPPSVNRNALLSQTESRKNFLIRNGIPDDLAKVIAEKLESAEYYLDGTDFARLNRIMNELYGITSYNNHLKH